jgi:hypothetical protein
MARGPKFDELSGDRPAIWALMGAVVLSVTAIGLSTCGPMGSDDAEWATVPGQVISTDCARHQVVVFSYIYEGQRFTNSDASPVPCERLRTGEQLPVQLLKLSPQRSQLVEKVESYAK